MTIEAGKALTLLCFLPEGKAKAVAAGAVPRLVHLLAADNSAQRTEAAGALAAVCIDDEGKAAVRMGLLLFLAEFACLAYCLSAHANDSALVTTPTVYASSKFALPSLFRVTQSRTSCWPSCLFIYFIIIII